LHSADHDQDRKNTRIRAAAGRWIARDTQFLMAYSRESRCNSGATARGAEDADPIVRVNDPLCCGWFAGKLPAAQERPGFVVAATRSAE
jgi:hypothetical protein